LVCILQEVTLGNFKNIFLYKGYISNYTEVFKRTAVLAFSVSSTKCLPSKDKAKLKVQQRSK